MLIFSIMLDFANLGSRAKNSQYLFHYSFALLLGSLDQVINALGNELHIYTFQWATRNLTSLSSHTWPDSRAPGAQGIHM